MIEWLIGPFLEFSFMQRALVGALAISLSAAPVGVFLMLRRMSLTGDAIAHAMLPGVAVGFLFAGLSVKAMTVGGLIAGCAVSLFSGLVSRLTSVAEDASLAAFYLISLAAGVLIISSSGSNVDLLHVLFGSILALDDTALYLLATISSITLILLALLFRPIVVECLDRDFLQSVSPLSPIAYFAFLLLVVLNLIAGFNALGTLMSVGIMILPAAAARYWFKALDSVLLVACLFAFICSYLGLLLSYYLSWSTGPTIILVLGANYVLAFIFGRNDGIVPKLFRHGHLSA